MRATAVAFRDGDSSGRQGGASATAGHPSGQLGGSTVSSGHVESPSLCRATIPSFYHTTRSGAEALARRAWTRRWWAGGHERYSLVTSDAVLLELRNGEYPSREAALALAQELPLLEITPAVAEIVEAYVQHRLMPADPSFDALHLALASYHKCEFLVT